MNALQELLNCYQMILSKNLNVWSTRIQYLTLSTLIIFSCQSWIFSRSSLLKAGPIWCTLSEKLSRPTGTTPFSSFAYCSELSLFSIWWLLYSSRTWVKLLTKKTKDKKNTWPNCNKRDSLSNNTMKIVPFRIVMIVRLNPKKILMKKIKMLTGQILMEKKVQWMPMETRSKRRKEDF